MKIGNYAGEVWGRLTILSHVAGQKWLMKCECGTEKILGLNNVRHGKTRSCGCLHLDQCRRGIFRLKHGDAKKGSVKRLHNIWRGMIKRCYDIKQPAYQRYGARGVIVCPEWKASYISFKEWAIGHGYTNKLTIERKDNNGNYDPNNCKFIPIAEQARNRCTSVKYTKNGRTMCQAEWGRELGMNREQVIRHFEEVT